MFTCILTATGDGEKKVPCAIFKGRGKKLTDDDKEMLKNRKIKIFWSENGWNNQAVTENWLNFMFPTTSFRKKVLIWDSFATHISKETKKLMKQKRIIPICIPGGTYLFFYFLPIISIGHVNILNIFIYFIFYRLHIFITSA